MDGNDSDLLEPLSDEELANCVELDDNEDDIQHPSSPVNSVNVSIEVGMLFPDLEVVYGLYKSYAFAHGFGIRKRNVRENYALFVCHRSRFNPPAKVSKQVENSRRISSYEGIGCKAALHVYKEQNSTMWRITKFLDDHNHQPVSPNSITLLRSHKHLPACAQSLTESFSLAGIQIAKVPSVLGLSRTGFEARDCHNHMVKLRKIMYDVGDAQAVQNYCLNRQLEDPDFFYAIQLDENSRMVNFFWIDSRSRRAYENFGDAVTFDTTYRTNKYSMPFAPFVGLNHHMQSILFGCALLHNETEDTFCWLFQTWLTAMRGKMPISIITDQDQAIGNAIAKVLSGVRHRLCIWHITKKFPEKLSHLYHEHSDFMHRLMDCIYHASATYAFDFAWEKLMEDYKLTDNEWLTTLFNIREKWILIYNRSTFFAGMSTTQRSESINSFFDAFVHSSTTLWEFVTKYDMTLDKRYESFRREDFDSRHKERHLTLNMPMEEHAASIYTRNVFKVFHEQLTRSLQFSKVKLTKVGNRTTYQVWDKKVVLSSETVVIDMDTKNCSCSCMLFEWVGILCGHILTILHKKNEDEIPSQYILRRWCKHGNIIASSESGGGQSVDSALRILDLKQRHELIDELAGRSDKIHTFIRDQMDSIIKTARSLCESVEACSSSQSNLNDNTIPSTSSDIRLFDPNPSQTKGRKRIKSGIELATKCTVICSACKGRGHNRRRCSVIRDNV